MYSDINKMFMFVFLIEQLGKEHIIYYGFLKLNFYLKKIPMLYTF